MRILCSMANIKQISLFPNQIDYLETFYTILEMKIPSLGLLTRNISFFRFARAIFYNFVSCIFNTKSLSDRKIF
jgi:hypothetical protein